MLRNRFAARQPGGGEPLAHPLGFVRAERGWTYQDLVDAVARRVGNMSARREKAWRWEHRGVVPDRETQEALADELGVDRELVSTLGWPAWLPVGDRGGIAAPWTADGCMTALDATAGSALLDRRGFLVSCAGRAAATAAQWLTLTESPGTAAAVPVAAAGVAAAGAVEGLERRLPHLRAVEHALGGSRVRGLADAELRMVTDLLLSEGTWAASDAAVRRLFGVAAELARLAGCASLDTGHQAAAERYLTAALSAAHAAGDRLLGASVLRCLSAQYLDTGRPRDALTLARAARDGVPGGAPARVTVMLAMREAQVQAALGAADECDALIAEADAVMARFGGTDGGPCWAADFDEAEFRVQVAVCHALLHRYARADLQFTRALLGHPAERARDRAMYLARHAEVALAVGDPERAHRLAEEAASWAAKVESLRIRRRVEALHPLLRRQRGRSSAPGTVGGAARSLIA